MTESDSEEFSEAAQVVVGDAIGFAKWRIVPLFAILATTAFLSAMAYGHGYVTQATAGAYNIGVLGFCTGALLVDAYHGGYNHE